jgi:hypothetical protein
VCEVFGERFRYVACEMLRDVKGSGVCSVSVKKWCSDINQISDKTMHEYML